MTLSELADIADGVLPDPFHDNLHWKSCVALAVAKEVLYEAAKIAETYPWMQRSKYRCADAIGNRLRLLVFALEKESADAGR